MALKYLSLKENWMLRGWLDIPWSLVNKSTGEQLNLTKEGFYAASSCDGKSDITSPIFLPIHKSIIKKLIEKNIIEEHIEPTEIKEYQKYDKAPNEHILGIQWAITGKCNLKCKHCYMEAPTGIPGELPFDKIENVIKKLSEGNILQVSLTGGEPFVRKDFIDILELLLKYNIYIKDIFTNGTLLNKNHLDYLKKRHLDPVFRISYDGFGCHDLMRGITGVEEKVISTVKMLKNEGFKVSLTTSVDSNNINCLVDTYEKMKELKVDSWGIARPQPVGCGRELQNKVSLEKMVEVCEELQQKWLMDGRPFMIGLEAFYSGNNTSIKKDSIEFDEDSYACSSCRKWPFLAEDGKLMPCISYGDTEWVELMPSILDNTVASSLLDKNLRKLLDIKKKDVLANNPECAECSFLSQCGTGCRTSALISGGNLFGKDEAACILWREGYKKHFEQK